MKIKFSIIIFFFLFVFTGGCTDNERTGPQEKTPIPSISPEIDLGIDLASIPVVMPDPSEINGSYIAEIALQDERAKQILQHGGKIEKITIFPHSCVPGDTCIFHPALVLRYGDVWFNIHVDEERGEVVSGYANVPAMPDRTRPDPVFKVTDRINMTTSVYRGDILVISYNDSAILYLNESCNNLTPNAAGPTK